MARVELNIVALGDFTSVNNQIKALKAQVDALNKSVAGVGLGSSLVRELNNANAAFKQTMLSTGQFTETTVKLKTETEKFGEALVGGKLKLTEYFDIIKGRSQQAKDQIRALAVEQTKLQNSIIVADPTKQGVFSVYTPTKINEIASATKIATNMQNLYNIAVEKGSQSLINWGKNTQWAGRQLTVGLTVPMTIFGNQAMQAFQQVNDELVRMQKVYGTGLTQPTQQALADIKGQVTALAQELARSMGIAAKDTAAMAADLAATGLTGADLINSTREALRLSKLGELDTQQAMQTTISLQNVYKLSTTELTGAINFLNAVENQTSTSLQDLVDAIPRVGPVVKQMGGSFKDTAAMMVALKEAGVPAAQAANAIKSSLASLINPTTAATQAFANYGINLKGIVSANQGNIIGQFMELQTQLTKLEPLARQQLIEKLFGKFQFARVSALLDNLGKVGSQSRTVFELMGASSQQLADLASSEMKISTESTTGKFKRAVETIKADLIPLGEKITVIATKLLNFGDAVGKVFKDLPGPVKSIMGILAAGVALAGPIIMLTGVFANFVGYVLKGVFAFRNLITGTKTFGDLFTPEIIASQNAADLMSKKIIEDAQAVNLLDAAVRELTLNLQNMAAAMSTVAEATFVQSAATAVENAAFKIPFSHLSGGMKRVPGNPSDGDAFPAMLQGGEAVIPADVATAHPRLMSNLVEGKVPPGYMSGSPGVYYGGSRKGKPTTERPNELSGVAESALNEFGLPGEHSALASLTANLGAQYGLNEKQMGNISGAHLLNLAHVAPAEYVDIAGQQRKVWDINNLRVSSGAENKGLEYVNRQGPLGNAFRSAMAASPSGQSEAGKAAVAAISGGKQPMTKLEQQIFIEAIDALEKSVKSGALKNSPALKTAYVGRDIMKARVAGNAGLSGDISGLVIDQKTVDAAIVRNKKSGKKVGEEMDKAVKEGLGEHSKSAKAKKAGKDYGEGLEEGLKGTKPGVERAAKELSDEVDGTVNKGLNKESLKSKLNGKWSASMKMGGSAAMMAGSMLFNQYGNKLPGADIVSSAMSMGSMGMMFGPWGAAAGAAIGLVTGGIQKLIAVEKEHKAEAESVFTVSAGEVDKYRASIDNATVSINNLNAAAGNVKTPIGASMSAADTEKKRLDALKDNDPEKLFYKKLQGMSKGSEVAYAIQQRASALIGQGADPKQVAASMQILASAAGQGQYSGLIGQTLAKNVGTQGQGLQNFLRQQYYDKNVQYAMQNGGVMPEYNATAANGRYYSGYAAQQARFAEAQGNFDRKIYQAGSGVGLENTAKTLLSTSTNAKKLKEITDALSKSQFNTASGTKMLAQAMINTQGPMKAVGVDMMKIANLPMAQALKVMRAASVAETNAARQEADKAYAAAVKAGDKTKTFLEWLAKPENQKYLDKLNAVVEKPLPGITDPNKPGGLDTTLNTGPTKLDKAYDVLIKKENLYISAMEKRLKAQQDINSELKRQQDYAISQTDIDNQIKQAMATGDYLKANQLRQQKAEQTDQYNIQTITNANQSILDKARQKLADLQQGKADAKTITKAMQNLVKDTGWRDLPKPGFNVPVSANYGTSSSFGTLDNSTNNYTFVINSATGDPKQIAAEVQKIIAAQNGKSGTTTKVGG